MIMRFGVLNSWVLGIYLTGMILIGLRFARRQTSREEYFLAGRRMPWLPVAMSMFASLTSAVTFMGLPAAAFHENMALLVVCFVSPALVPLLVGVIYPVYRRMHVTTSYEYIGERFGPAARTAVSGLFVLARLGWMGTVIYAPALALSVASGLPRETTILLMGVLATAYTVLGGLSAVLWTDVVQYVILVAGAVWVAVTLWVTIPGGFGGILEVARAADHLHVVGWQLSLVEMSGFAVAISFFLQMMQDYGTDQVTVQRMLAIRSKGGMTRAVIFNAFTDMFMIALLLFIGLGLFVFYRLHPMDLDQLPGDSILPFFIMTRLPQGVSGLVISAIFAAAMSSMDSGINSLATVLENDIFSRWRRGAVDEVAAVRRARWVTIVLGVAATALAFYVARIGHIIKGFATFMSLFNAPVLALFLLGLVTRRATFKAWVVGAVLSIGATLWLQRVVQPHWVYFFPFSFAVAYVTTYVLSLFRS